MAISLQPKDSATERFPEGHVYETPLHLSSSWRHFRARRELLTNRLCPNMATMAAGSPARRAEIVFLSATDEVVARVYERLGFRRIGTVMIADLPQA